MVTPAETTTYTLTAVNDQGSSTSQVTVVVEKPSASVNLDTINIDIGESATVEWTTEFSDTCTLSPNQGSVDLAGSLTLSPDETTEYTLTCSRNGISVDSSFTIYVNNYAQIPMAEISAEPVAIHQGGSTVLNWVSANATEFFIDNGVGDVGPFGEVTVSPENTTRKLR